MSHRPGATTRRRAALLLALAAICLSVLVDGRAAGAQLPVAARAGTGTSLTATLLPSPERADRSRLAVDWAGDAGVHLRVSLTTAGRTSRLLVADQPLSAGANLLGLALPANAAGTLRMEVRGSSGPPLRILTEDLAALRAESAFAWRSGVSAALPGLMVGGSFDQAGAVPANDVARWDGSAWSAFTGPGGNGTDSQVSAMTVFNGDLIAGGAFVYAGGKLVRGIARWDGTDWQPLTGSAGTGVMTYLLDFVSSLQVFNGSLIVGGQFLNAGGLPANHIARWDGTEWHTLTGPSGTGLNSAAVWDLTVHNGALIAGGGFTEAGGVPASRIARWDGSAWSALAGGINPGELNGSVASLENYNGNLVAAGSFDTADGVQVNNIARWNGNAWSALTGPSGTGLSNSVRDMAVYQGTLVVGGEFTHAGSLAVNHVARWDGSAWSAFTTAPGTTLNSTVYAVTVHYGELIVGGGFTQALGSPTDYLARWTGTGWASLPGGGPNGWVAELFSL
ncbi:hypothetical protein O7626_07700 [Micromonospora sp. WMMD1102]|uniref:hypothetical protein n=1 Tax=Micromonospora sp. WMMD1102 TaxID=3016105 RepID=UPI0024150CA9|nr:hypothetical protein [Micromonospora sp. WMMD1102]MDG4785811.1 hypothetical protein [Micromonospora sp. WMMD1102]